MYRSFFLDGWSDRAVRWEKCEVFDAADSERSARPESPTSPNAWIGTYREKQNLCTQCSREDCEQGIIPTDELDPEEMRPVMAESSRFSCLHLNSIVSMTLHLVFLKPAVRTTINSWCSLSSCTRILRVVRAVDTIDGQLFIDLILR